MKIDIFFYWVHQKSSYLFCLTNSWRGMAVIFLFLGLHVSAQSRFILIHADFSRGQKIGSVQELRILEGRVHAMQDTVEIFCDRADYFPSLGKAILRGNVRIHRGKEKLTAEEITYYTQSKMAVAKKNVYLERPGQNLRSEYLKYFYETDQAFAKTNLFLADMETGVYVTGQQGEYHPQEKRSIVKNNVHFWQVDVVRGDTMHIYSQVMEYIRQPERMAIARDSVTIIRGTLKATCDSAVFYLDKEIAYLEINPRATQLNNKLSGQQMELDFKGSELRKIIVKGRAVAISVEDSVANNINRLTGQKIRALISNKKIDQLLACDNARSFYYLNDQGQDQGINTASADTIRIFFTESELDSITVQGGSQGIYYPAEYQGKIDTEY